MGKKKEPSLFCDTLSVKDHASSLIKYMTDGIYEKQHIMSMALLAAIAGESVFLLGPPGTAKSMVARRLKLVFKDAKAFEYLMSRFSTPDEIFGPVSISKLKNEDRYERLVDGYLPDAEIVFLDEIWKAGPSIQNALLTAINERIFKNGSDTLKLPMKALIAASNELPAEDEGLEALWDRFLVRIVSNCISSETTFYKMVREKSNSDPIIPPSLLITEELYHSWQSSISDIVIPDDVCHVITAIRKAIKEEMKSEDFSPMDYYISDRRWKKVFHLMQASAWLNDRDSINITDCFLLIHCLWNKTQTISKVLEIVPSAITSGIDVRIAENKTALDKLIAQLSANMPQGRVPITEDDDEFAVTNYFYYTVDGFNKGKCLFSKADYNHVDTKKTTDGILYFDERNNCWMIHAIYTGAPFDYKMSNGKLTKLKLQKCNGGIIVDSIPYAFKRKSRFGAKGQELQTSSFTSTEIIFEECESIKNDFSELQSMFANSTNIFVSSDDKKLIMRQLSKTEKEIGELEIKIKNTKLLIR